MTSGGGITHSEEATGHYRGTLEGIQLWVALPEDTRRGAGGLEHHADLPQAEVDGGVATVLLGEFADQSSPARGDTPLVGVDLDLHGSAALPLRPDWEYAMVVLQGEIAVNGQALVPGRLGYLGEDRSELPIEARERARVVLLGGEPFPDPIIMWWNFVARTQQEVEDAWRAWQAEDADRYGRVDSPLARIPAKPPWWVQDRERLSPG
jgi:redox-sensitive bicupin YhaK (pirin superfamily)